MYALSLKNARQAIQRLMDRVRAGLEFNFIYMDNILVTSMDEQSTSPTSVSFL